MNRIVSTVTAVLLATLVGCGSNASTSATPAPIDSPNPSMSVAPTDCPSSNTETLPKARALADLGLIYAASKYGIIDPYKQGKLSSTAGKVKAGLAVAAAYGLSKKLLQHVNASPLLCKTLGTPVRTIVNSLGSLKGLGSITNLGSLTALGGAISALPGLGAPSGGKLDLKSLALAAAGL